MSDTTLIAWTDHTFNPWMGCTKVSAGCAHCYAEALTTNRMGRRLWGDSAPRQVTKSPWAHIKQWERAAAEGQAGILGAGRPHLVFLGSLMDWAEDRPDLSEPRGRMWEVIRCSPHLHFQLLTKRPENIRRFLPDDWGPGYPNVWLGTSIEDMRVSNRADILRDIPAVVRFISYEPALGPLDGLDLAGLDWVIFGGESGPKFREADPQWSRDMRRHCEANNVAYFHKQSSHFFTERGITLDGETVRNFPIPRVVQTTQAIQVA